MIRTTRMITECKCRNCGIIHLLDETFNGQRCCINPDLKIIGEREVPQYTKTNAEEAEEVKKAIIKTNAEEAEEVKKAISKLFF